MADVFGAIALPIPAPASGAAVSDSCLDTLLDFFKSVLNADVTTAWQTVCPGKLPVENVFAHNPQERSFNDNKLPALYLYRSGSEPIETLADDIEQVAGSLTLRWVFPPAPQERQRQRDPIANGLTKSLARALYNGRHAAWVVPGDLADADAVKVPIATSTAAQTYSGAALNGVIGAGSVSAARPLTITTSAAVGAYSTASIVVTGLDAQGAVLTDTIALTLANGVETIATLWCFASITSVALPAMLLATGTIELGFAASPEATRGSLVHRYAGVDQLDMKRPGAAKALPIRPADNGGPPVLYEMVEFELRILEVFAEDVSGFDAFKDAQGGAAGAVDILHDNGTTLESFNLLT